MKKKATNTVSELNALCDVLHTMRKGLKLSYGVLMYKRFCKNIGTMKVQYFTSLAGNIWAVYFQYTSLIGSVNKLIVNVIKPYKA